MLEVVKKYENARNNPTYTFVRAFLVKDGDCGGVILRYNNPMSAFSILRFGTLMEAVLFVQAATHEGFFKEIDPKSQYWHGMTITQRIIREFGKTKEYSNRIGLYWFFGSFISRFSSIV